MSKRFFLALALTGVLGFAFASPTQAGTVQVNAGFIVLPDPVTGPGTATDMEITFVITAGGVITTPSGSVVHVADGGLTSLVYTVDSPTSIRLDFDASSGSMPAFIPGGNLPIAFQFDITAGSTLSLGSVGITGVVGGTAALGGASIGAVPEPASLALLGIGMTGFLAFRRFFKKTSVA